MTVLHNSTYPGGATSPTRKAMRFRLTQVAAGDILSVSAYPHDNHDCDGLYIAQWQLWRSSDAAELSIFS